MYENETIQERIDYEDKQNRERWQRDDDHRKFLNSLSFFESIKWNWKYRRVNWSIFFGFMLWCALVTILVNCLNVECGWTVVIAIILVPTIYQMYGK